MDFPSPYFVYILFYIKFINAAADPVYLNAWAVHVKGGERKAREVARRHGFAYVNQIIDDHYLLEHHHVTRRSTQSSQFHHSLLADDKEVLWLEQQVVKRRVKRDFVSNYNDPRWRQMWYLNRKKAPNMNVEKAWAKGYTGKNVAVSILDDGIERTHPDLAKNYDSESSTDINGRDDDPMPRYDYSNENRHGTRCAGEVAAQANNNICGVGVAYDSKIGGVRMLDGDVTDSVEAHSLQFSRQHIDIYSASWGPDDDGRTVDGPSSLAKKAFRDGVSKGRGGLGSIFVWASGNGGRNSDSCNCDGYTNSIYTLSISSVSEYGNVPWYSEACSSTLATTYSSGIGGEKQIITTDLHRMCTDHHTGTSASAPLAAGICALAIQANPNLTWRDMQHIVVRTAKKANLQASDWRKNAVGRWFSHSYGYGLMDASAMVDLALNWTMVPPQHLCEITSKETNRVIPHRGKIQIPLYSEGCKGRPSSRVHFLEHVQARVTLTADKRGEVSIFLVSPQGTNSTLLARRVRDLSQDGFNQWEFMTTHMWGEVAVGTWNLEVKNGGTSSRPVNLREITLMMYGTETDPVTKMVPVTTTVKPATIAMTTPKHPAEYKRKKHLGSQEFQQPSRTVPIKDQKIFTQCRFKPVGPRLFTATPPRGSNTRLRNGGKSVHRTRIPSLGNTDVKTSAMLDTRQPTVPTADSKSAMLKSWTLVLRGTALDGSQSSGGAASGGKANTNGVANHQFEIPPGAGDAAGAMTSPSGCANGVSATQCLVCPAGSFMVDGSCVRKCPAGFYGSVSRDGDKSNAVCYQCDRACLTCHGPTIHECFSCASNWVRNGTTCMSTFSIRPSDIKYLILGVLAFFAVVILLVATFIITRTCSKNKKREAEPTGPKSGKVEYHKIAANGSDVNLLDYLTDSEDESVEVGAQIKANVASSYI